MAYNRKKEYKKWIIKKEREEKILKEQGVTEEYLVKLRELDKEMFNQDRRFNKHNVITSDRFFICKADEKLKEYSNLDEILDCIENEALFNIFVNTDKITLRIIDLKFQGYKVSEIGSLMNMSDYQIYRRIKKFKNNYKKSPK